MNRIKKCEIERHTNNKEIPSQKKKLENQRNLFNKKCFFYLMELF